MSGQYEGTCESCDGRMVSVLDPTLDDPGLSPDRRHHVLFISKKICSQRTSLYPDQMFR